MLEILFQGWFQCRLATNPDPADEPRGVSGSTFATPDEPDLDRVIRFQPEGCVDRGCGSPKVGVHVNAVLNRNQSIPDHPLLGASVNLLGEPVFQSGNDGVMPQGTQIIDPFIVELRQGTRFLLRRRDQLDPRKPDASAYDVPTKALARRAGRFELNPLIIAEATGITDAREYRSVRLEALKAQLRVEKGPARKVALELRGDRIRRARTGMEPMGLVEHRAVSLNGKPVIRDPAKLLGGPVNPRIHWPIAFWMGAWDEDALCGFVRGRLSLPVRLPARRARS